MGREQTKLIIIHYHLRPGGVRRIIELATPHLVKGRGAQVILATGEPPDEPWWSEYSEAVAPVPVSVIVEKSFRYISEQKSSPKNIRSELERAMDRLFASATPTNTIVWAHNLGIGRNLLLTDTLTRACAVRQIPLLAHHHDWWFDNRWRAWAEMRDCDFRSRGQIAQTIFNYSKSVRHLTINSSDADMLRGRLSGRVAWLPNLTERVPKPPMANVERARAWVRKNFTTGDAPLWLVPARLLRRKNIAEALLLMRWLRPEAFLITTAGVSSTEEVHYGERLKNAAQRHKWPLRLGILQNAGRNAPTLAELMAASEAILLPSIQEGFGLPFIEAASAGRPLIARSIPNIMPDLDKFGFRFPQLYEDILITPDLFDWSAERAAQQRLFQNWRKALPQSCRKWAGEPLLLQRCDSPAVPFSRLTLRAQLEVLAQPASDSFRKCEPLNDFLSAWRKRVEARNLHASAWPKAAYKWLSGANYAKRFWRAAQRNPQSGVASNVEAVQDDFIRQKLAADNLFPLLMARET